MEIGSFVSCLILAARTFNGAVHGGTNPQFPSLDRKFFFDTDVMFTSIFTLDFFHSGNIKTIISQRNERISSHLQDRRSIGLI